MPQWLTKAYRWLKSAASIQARRILRHPVRDYRLRTDDGTCQVRRVVQSEVIGDHLRVTDLDGCAYIVRLSSVVSYQPVKRPQDFAQWKPIPVEGVV